MAIQRRRMLTAALGGAFSASVLTAGRVDPASRQKITQSPETK